MSLKKEHTIFWALVAFLIFPYLSGLYGKWVYQLEFVLLLALLVIVDGNGRVSKVLVSFFLLLIIFNIMNLIRSEGRVSFSDFSRFGLLSLTLLLFRPVHGDFSCSHFESRYKLFLLIYTVVSWVVFLDYFNISNYYGVSPIFDDVYNRYRYIGIAGQPGANSLINAVLLFSSLNVLKHSRSNNAIFLLFFVSSLIFMHSSSSRAVMLLFIMFLPLYGYAVFSFNRNSILLIVGAAMVALQVTRILTRGSGNLNESTFNSLNIRVEKWIQAWSVLSEHPSSFLFGIPSTKLGLQQHYPHLRQPDSGLLSVFIDFGVVGGGVYLFFVILVFAKFGRYSKSRSYMLLSVILMFLLSLSFLDQIDTLKVIIAMFIYMQTLVYFDRRLPSGGVYS